MKYRITMKSPIKERAAIDIGKTVEKHVSFVSELLPAHALTGCDTVACYCIEGSKRWSLIVIFRDH